MGRQAPVSSVSGQIGSSNMGHDGSSRPEGVGVARCRELQQVNRDVVPLYRRC